MIAQAFAPSASAQASDAWPVVTTKPVGYMPMREACRRAKNSGHYTGSRHKEAIRGWITRLAKCSADGPHQPVKWQGQLYIHPSIHPALSEPASRIPECARSGRESATTRSRVKAKLEALKGLALFLKANTQRLGGETATTVTFIRTRGSRYSYFDGDARVVLRFSAASLRRWQDAYKERGVDALAEDGRGKWQRGGPSPEASARYWQLRGGPNKRKIVDCWRTVATEAREKGWRWFDNARTCGAWDRRTRNERALTLSQGRERRDHMKCLAYMEHDVESFAPGECWVADDSTMNVWVRRRDGRVIRPTISAWQDWRARCIVGYRLIEHGNEHAILPGFSSGVRDFGVPATVILDNGKNFVSYMWQGGRPVKRTHERSEELVQQREGIFALCGVNVSLAQPFNPDAKARLERWFGTIDSQLCRSFPSYCGSCPDNRPASHAKLVERAVEWDDFVAAVARYVETYNGALPHSGEGMDGQTPLQVMAQAPRKRVLPEAQHDLLLAAWHRPVKLHRNGVSIKVSGHTIRYGADSPELLALPIGTEVRVCYDPADIRFVTIRSVDYKLICQAEMNFRSNRAIPSEAFRDVLRKRRREQRILRDAYKVGPECMINPVDRTLVALAEDGKRRKLPDPPPDGGPTLVPVRTLVEDGPAVEPYRKAVGAEAAALMRGLAEADERRRAERNGNAAKMEISRQLFGRSE